MDLDTLRYENYDQLEHYCHRVASVVGLLSIEIFGFKNPACHDYAVYLGKALQLTNILRDVRTRSEEHTSELQSLRHLVCRLLLEKKDDELGLPAGLRRGHRVLRSLRG